MSDSAPQIPAEVQDAIDRLRATDALGAFNGIQVGDQLIFRARVDFQGNLPATTLAPLSGRHAYFAVPAVFEAKTWEDFVPQCTKIADEQ